MEIVIGEAMVNLALKAIEAERPEVLSAYSEGYNPVAPWNYNRPGHPITLQANNTVVAFDARGSNPAALLAPADFAVSLQLDASIQRSGWLGRVENAHFLTRIELGGQFGPKVKKKDGYPLILERVLIVGLDPSGVQTLLSWLLASSLTESLAGSLFPATINLIDKKLNLSLSQPAVVHSEIRLSGSLEGLT